MQEKNLEEEFKSRFKVKIETYPSGTFAGYCLWDNLKNDFATREELISFISSREEKAREEGRKEEKERRRKEEGLMYPLDFQENIVVEKAITQYKEELLLKLPKKATFDNMDTTVLETRGEVRAWNECLSEIKKLL